MNLEQALRLTAGVVLLIVTTIGLIFKKVDVLFSLIYYFMSINMIQSAFTNWCPIVWLYRKIGLKECK